MKLLRLYCLKELTTPLLMSLALFTFIFLVGNLVKLADLLVNRGVNLFDIFKILLLLLPQVIAFVLPTGTLAAVLLVFGGFAQNNEIAAMKASGVNVLRVMIPIMLVSFLMSLLALFFVDQIQPRAHHLLRSTVNDLMVKKPQAYIESGRFIKDFKGYIIRVQKVDNKRLEGVTIFQPQEGKPTRTIMAEWGEIVSSANDRELGLKLYNGVSDEPNPDDPTVMYKMNFDTFVLPAMTLSDSPQQRVKKKIKDMSINELLLVLRNMKEYRENLETKGWDKHDVDKDIESLTRETKSEVQRKISFSFATFSFVMVGLPLAIVTRRGEVVVSFALSLLVVAIYYILSIWMKTLAVNGLLPPVIALWFPNILVIAAAVFFMKKVIRL